MFLDWKNQSCQNDYITQSNLQIQCNPYKITNDTFHRNRTKFLPFVFNHERPEITLFFFSCDSKTNLEESDSLTSDYTTKLE